MIPFKTAYGPKLKISMDFSASKDRTKQSFKAECDINTIMARARKTGVIDFANRYQPQYADVTGHTYQAAQDTIARAKGMFFSMPAHVRDRFENNPRDFLAWIQNPNNQAEARTLGLMKPEVEQPAKPAAETPANPTAGGPTPALPLTK